MLRRFAKVAVFAVVLGSLLVAAPAGATARFKSANGCGHESVKSLRVRFKSADDSYERGGRVVVTAHVTRKVRGPEDRVQSGAVSDSQGASAVSGALVSVSLKQGDVFVLANGITDESGNAGLMFRIPRTTAAGTMNAAGMAWREAAEDTCVFEISNFLRQREFITVR